MGKSSFRDIIRAKRLLSLLTNEIQPNPGEVVPKLDREYVEVNSSAIVGQIDGSKVGIDLASPSPIGNVQPNTAKFTTVSTPSPNNGLTVGGFSYLSYLANHKGSIRSFGWFSDGNILTGGAISTLSDTASTSPTTGSIWTLGGLGVSKDAYFGGEIYVQNVALKAEVNKKANNSDLSSLSQQFAALQASLNEKLDKSALNETVRRLFVQNTLRTVTGTTNEVIVATFTIPAGTMTVNSCLEFELLASLANTGSNKTVRVKIGATTIFSITHTNNAQSVNYRRTLRNRDSINSQVIYPSGTNSFGSLGTPPSNFNIDFSIDQIVTVTIQNQASADTSNLSAFTLLKY